MSEPLDRDDPYRREAEARVVAAAPGAIVLDDGGA
jgi:Ser-tRNA(Ala) deacylase AlaX